MGGFGSRHAGHVAEEGAAKPRSTSGDAEQSPQAFVVSFSPDTPTMPGSAGSAQPSQAPRQKQPAPSLHVNRRLINDTLANDWDGGGAAGSSGVALAEEEDLQAAIAASLREDRSGSGPACHPNGGHVCHAAGSGEFRPPLKRGISDAGEDSRGQSRPDPRERETAIASKREFPSQSRPSHGASHQVAAGLGLAGDYAWVDNSGFHKPVDQASADRTAHAAARSASVGTQPKSKGANSRSGIVNLPRIGKVLSADQQSMVKDLHEKIKDTISPEEAALSQNGPLASSASSSDARRVMEDLNIDEPIISRGPRGGSAEREYMNERFNERFASCSAAPANASLLGRYESPFRSDQRQRGPSL